MTYTLEKIKEKVKQLSLMYAVDDFNLVLLGSSVAVVKETAIDCDRLEFKLTTGDYDRLKRHKEFFSGILIGDFEYMVSKKFPDVVFYRGSEKYTGWVQTLRHNGLYCYSDKSMAKHRKLCQIIRQRAATKQP